MSKGTGLMKNSKTQQQAVKEPAVEVKAAPVEVKEQPVEVQAVEVQAAIVETKVEVGAVRTRDAHRRARGQRLSGTHQRDHR